MFKNSKQRGVISVVILLVILLLLVGNKGLQPSHVVEAAPLSSQVTVVLDPGHGYRGDIGARGNGMREVDIVLDVAQRAKSILEQRGIRVLLTHTETNFNHSRYWVNNHGAVVAVSIHANAGGGTGTEACITRGKSTDAQSRELGDILVRKVTQRLGLYRRGLFEENRPGRRCGNNVNLSIHYFDAPAALIELAFIDGPQNNDVYKLRYKRQDFAQAIADGILEYLDNHGYGNASCPPSNCTPGRSVGRPFFEEVLRGLGLPVTEFGVRALDRWQDWENTNACWNPLATTRRIPGWLCNFNGVGVQNYRDQSMGIRATVETLKLSYYTPIRQAFACQGFDHNAIKQSLRTWGTCSDCTAHVNEWWSLYQSHCQSASCPPSNCTPGRSVGRPFFEDVLRGLGLPVTDFGVEILTLWQQDKQTGDCWNPLETTRNLAGSCTTNAHARHYKTQAQGVQATVETLRLSYYTSIRQLLAGQNPNWSAIHQALRTWGGCSDGGCNRLLQQWQQSYARYHSPSIGRNSDDVGVFMIRGNKGYFLLYDRFSRRGMTVTYPIGTPIVGDWDGDGYDDVGVVVQRNGRAVYMMYSPTTRRSWQVVYPAGTPIVGDWDGDGYDDVGVVVQRNGRAVYMMYSPRARRSWQVVYAVGTPIIGDWDGDGKDDVGVVVQRNGRAVYMMYSPTARRSWQVTHSVGTPIIGDWDGDGKDDVGVMVQRNGRAVYMMYSPMTRHSWQVTYPVGTPVVGNWGW